MKLIDHFKGIIGIGNDDSKIQRTLQPSNQPRQVRSGFESLHEFLTGGHEQKSGGELQKTHPKCTGITGSCKINPPNGPAQR